MLKSPHMMSEAPRRDRESVQFIQGSNKQWAVTKDCVSHLVSVKLLKHGHSATAQTFLYLLNLDISCSTSGSDYVTMQGKRPEVCARLCLYHLVCTSLKMYWKWYL